MMNLTEQCNRRIYLDPQMTPAFLSHSHDRKFRSLNSSLSQTDQSCTENNGNLIKLLTQP
jgi:hypothetical protein